MIALWRSIAIGLLIGAFPIFLVACWDWCNRYLVPPFERWLRRRWGLPEHEHDGSDSDA